MTRIDVVREHFRERVPDYIDIEPKPLPVVSKGSGKLLEVGCGTRLSYFAEGLEKYGLDLTLEMIRLFKKRNPEAYAILGDVMSLPFKKGTFKVIVSNVLLHHLVGKRPRMCRTNIKIAMKEMKRVIEQEGFVIIRELIARNYLFSLLMFYTTLLTAKLGIDINYLDIHTKVVTFFVDDKTFMKTASEVGFQVNKLRSEEWKFRRFKLGATTEYLLSSKAAVVSATERANIS